MSDVSAAARGGGMTRAIDWTRAALLAGITAGFGFLAGILFDRWPLLGFATALPCPVSWHFLIDEIVVVPEEPAR